MKNCKFYVGTVIEGTPYTVKFSKLRLYACRLYTRCLNKSEVEKNYYGSVNYHKYLIGDEI